MPGDCYRLHCRGFYYHSIFKAYMLAGDCRDALSWYYDARQVQGISSGDGDELFCVGDVSRGPRGFYGDGQRKLFTDECGDEASAADLASVFQAAEGDQEFTPAGQDALAGQQLAEDHAVAVQQHAADSL